MSSFDFSPADCHHLIPVGGGAPIALHCKGGIRVSAGADGDAVFRSPVCPGTEVAHQLQGQVDVGAGDDVARQVQAQPFGKYSANHQQSGYVLRADTSGEGYFFTFQFCSGDAQRGKAFIPGIFYLCAELT